MIKAVFILSLLVFFIIIYYFLIDLSSHPFQSLHAQLIINKSAFVRDFDKEANQKYLKMLSFDP